MGRRIPSAAAVALWVALAVLGWRLGAAQLGAGESSEVVDHARCLRANGGLVSACAVTAEPFWSACSRHGSAPACASWLAELERDPTLQRAVAERQAVLGRGGWSPIHGSAVPRALGALGLVAAMLTAWILLARPGRAVVSARAVRALAGLAWGVAPAVVGLALLRPLQPTMGEGALGVLLVALQAAPWVAALGSAWVGAGGIDRAAFPVALATASAGLLAWQVWLVPAPTMVTTVLAFLFAWLLVLAGLVAAR